MALQIKPELLNEWKKQGEILAIWGCPRCHKKVVFYKSDRPLINSIHWAWAHNHEYCEKCYNKINGVITVKKKVEISRINLLLKKYEPPEESWLCA